LGKIFAQRVQQHRGFPKEHARVPVEVAGLDVAARGFEIRFFAKAAHLHGLARSGLDILGKFDVSVAGLGPARLNAEHDDLSAGGRLRRGTDESQIAARFRDHVVGRKDAHHRVGIDGLQDMGGQSDGGRGVALRGFGQDLALRGTSGNWRIRSRRADDRW
jgi:hypothetical protein